MADFNYSDLLPLSPQQTPYRLLTNDGVETFDVGGDQYLRVHPDALTRLAYEGMHDIAHYLRPGHLQQLATILDDPEASPNDRFVALDLLKNANISAGGVLPMCQDTGTAIVMGKKGERVVTGGGDEEAISRGIFDAYTRLNLRYSQMAPLTMWDEQNTGTNLPAQIDLYATDGDEYHFLLMAKGGGSANKSFLFQETKAILNPDAMRRFLDEKLRTLGTAACPPYHLAVVIGGTSAEAALKTAKLASASISTPCPPRGHCLGTASATSRWRARSSSSHSSSGSVRSSGASTSATMSASFDCRGMAPASRSPSQSRVRPTARRKGRSPLKGSFSSSSRPILRGISPRSPTSISTTMWSASTSTIRCPRFVQSSAATP